MHFYDSSTVPMPALRQATWWVEERRAAQVAQSFPTVAGCCKIQ